MPFTRITEGKDKGKFRSPSGRILTMAQVRAYYAKTGGGKKPTKKKG